MSDPIKIRRALISVHDKTGIVEFARALHEEFGVELISTGGTAKVLKDAGLPVTLVEDITGSPEMLDGRVKTLHPKIHAAILADRDNPEHMRQLKAQGIEPIDMVVVNLYPFEQTIARPDCTFEEAIEMIDIGGPCLLRAAAKNHRHVLAVSRPFQYENVLEVLRGTGLETRETLELDLGWGVFATTESYDLVIREYLGSKFLPLLSRDYGITEDPAWGPFAPKIGLLLEKRSPSRYGENPHQRAAVYRLEGSSSPFRSAFKAYKKGEMSFNNFVDANAALELCAELTRARGLLGVGDRPPVAQTGQRPVPQAGKACGGPTSGRSMRKATTEEHFSRRPLPHIEHPEATYFLTFRLRTGELGPDERDLVLAACRFWHGRKMMLHCATVMPDHVHLLLTPYEPQTERWVPLGELLKSIKTYSSTQVNKLRGPAGSLWLDENFDRIIRDERDFLEKWEYIRHNAVTTGLVGKPEEYKWFWQSGLGFGEIADDRPVIGLSEQQADRPEVGPPNLGVARPCAVCFIKHTNACGVAVDADPVEAYRQAYLGDPNAAMGGILAVNFAVTPSFAEAVMETYQRWGKAAGAGGFFVEVWLAPTFDEAAVQVIRKKKEWGQRVRLLAVGDMSAPPDPGEMDLKRIAGGVLMQTRDLLGLNEEQWRVVTKRAPSDAEMDDLRLAWLICKHTKSNAITICRDGMLIGNGAGQMSRVMSCRIATWLAQENGHADQLRGAVAASDAFFPFRDGADIVMGAGVTALIQPGGSKRDEDTVKACDERGVAMIFTGTRHFKH